MPRRGPLLAPAAALLALGLIAPPALAQPAPAPPAPAPPAPAQPASPSAPLAPSATPAPIVPPRLDPPPTVAYPEGAVGDAEVMLTLVVEKDGRVRSAEVTEGREPFATVARDAARTWQFSPATREGVPVAARIRFALGFHAPAPIEPEPPNTPSPDSPPPDPISSSPKPPPPPPKPLEVLVRAEKPPPSVSTLSRAEVRQLPGAFGDPFRAIEILPGVTPIVSGLPFFYVRGAPPGNVGYFLDGVRVPYLFHVAAGPSVVNPALVERVDLYSGGYPARYGRYAGAVVAAETAAPRDDWHGEGNLRIYDVGALVEGGFAGGRGTALVGGRYSYTAALFSVISPTVHLDYRDYQARVTYDLGPRDRIGLFAFGSYDLLEQEKNGVNTILFGSEFYRVDLRYDHRLDHGGTLRWAATWGFDQTWIGEQRNAQDLLLGTRVELTQPFGEALTLRGGVDAQFDTYSADKARWVDPDDPGINAFNDVFRPRSDGVLGAWADVVWRVDPRIEVIPGLRVDLYHSGSAFAGAADPRLSVRVEVTRKIRLLEAFGLAHQTPSFIVPLPGLALASLRGGLQTSLQASAGVEVDLPWSTTATITVFDDVFLNMSDILGIKGGGNPTEDARSLGSAYGLEVYLRRRLSSQLGGFISYTLSRSVRREGPSVFPSAFDRTHVLNTALSYDLGRGWRAGARFTLYTGAPLLDADTLALAALTGTIARDPLFYRIDARIEKRWSLGRTRWLSLVLEMLNTTLHKEVIRSEEVGPIAIPSLGLEGGL